MLIMPPCCHKPYYAPLADINLADNMTERAYPATRVHTPQRPCIHPMRVYTPQQLYPPLQLDYHAQHYATALSRISGQPPCRDDIYEEWILDDRAGEGYRSLNKAALYLVLCGICFPLGFKGRILFSMAIACRETPDCPHTSILDPMCIIARLNPSCVIPCPCDMASPTLSSICVRIMIPHVH